MSEYQLHHYDSDLMVPATGAERLAAAACHAAPVFALPFLLPIAVFFLFPVVQPASGYVRHQALQAALFHTFAFFVMTVLFTVGHVFLAIVLIGWPLAAVFYLAGCGFTCWAFWVMCVATMKAFQGRPYRVPVVGNWGR